MPNWVSSDFVTSVLNREDYSRIGYLGPASPQLTTQQDTNGLIDGLIESGYLSRTPVAEPPPKRQEYTVICLWFAHSRWYWDYAAPPSGGGTGPYPTFGFHCADNAIDEAERLIAFVRHAKVLIEFGLPRYYRANARAWFISPPNED